MTTTLARPPTGGTNGHANNTPSLNRPVGSAKGLEGLLRSAQAQIERVLPRHLTPDRLIQIASIAVTRTPALARCTQLSLLTAVMRAGELGLDCSGALGSAYLVPFGTDCQLVIGYRGMIDLARRSGQIVSIEARVVYQNDEFDLCYGNEPTLTHRPALDVDPGKFRLVYAVARLVGGGVQTEVMTKAAVDAIRSRSRSGQSGPWVTDYDEMARKTVVKRLCKYLPLTIEVQEAISEDEGREFAGGRPGNVGQRNLNSPLSDAQGDPDGQATPADDGDTQLPPDEVAERVLTARQAVPADDYVDPATGEDLRPTGGIDGPTDPDGETFAVDDFRDWATAEKALKDRAKDVGLKGPNYITAQTGALGLAPQRSTPEQRLAFFHDIVNRRFDNRTGKRVEAAVAAT